MQSASSGSTASSGPSNLKKWGPIAAVAAVVVVGGGILIATSGGDDEVTTAPATTAPAVTEPAATDPPAGTDPPATEPEGTEAPDSTEAPDTSGLPGTGGITFPLSFTDATEQGIEVEWGERCDTATGRIAVPDFFAPDCYAPFEGDNGGATSRGVTADTISVVVYQGPDGDPVINYISDAVAVDDTNADERATIDVMLEFYATFYELYGRTVEFTYFEGSGIATDEVSARADAVRIAEDLQPFAVIGGPALTNAFADELAAREVLCIGCTPTQPAQWYVDRDPYVWGITAGSEQGRAHVLEFVTKQLVGRPAEHAGDEAFRTQERTFGLVYIESGAESQVIAQGYAAGLEAAGSSLTESLPYVLDPASIQQSAAQIIAKLKSSGVTTVILVGDPVAPRDFTREATAQQYFPEWVVGASALMDTTAFARTYDQQQWANAFGVTTLSARFTPENGGYYRLFRWYAGEEPPGADSIGVFMPGPALFHAVVQAAGPDLTPESFRDALFLIGDTQQAISQPYLSWGDRGYWDQPDYNGIDDATVFWWDPDATGPDEIRREGTGMWQYVDGGTRFLPGEWPTEPALFDPEGAVALYTEPPAGEEIPDYPSPAG